MECKRSYYIEEIETANLIRKITKYKFGIQKKSQFKSIIVWHSNFIIFFSWWWKTLKLAALTFGTRITATGTTTDVSCRKWDQSLFRLTSKSSMTSYPVWQISSSSFLKILSSFLFGLNKISENKFSYDWKRANISNSWKLDTKN